MKKILIVDDDKAISQLIKVNLELSGYSCLNADDGAKGFALAKQELPSLIILDVMMPFDDGFSVALKLSQNKITKNIPILMLTALGALNDKLKGFNSGVDDYLVKPFEMEELKARVNALLNRAGDLPESMQVKELLCVGDITLSPETYGIRIGEKTAKLTPIEYEILNILVQNHGQMVSASKFLQDVWGYSPNDDIETIRVHIRHLRTKIDKISCGKKYIETIYGGGYKLVPGGIS